MPELTLYLDLRSSRDRLANKKCVRKLGRFQNLAPIKLGSSNLSNLVLLALNGRNLSFGA